MTDFFSFSVMARVAKGGNVQSRSEDAVTGAAQIDMEQWHALLTPSRAIGKRNGEERGSSEGGTRQQ
jgi:hypothetical protein